MALLLVCGDTVGVQDSRGSNEWGCLPPIYPPVIWDPVFLLEKAFLKAKRSTIRRNKENAGRYRPKAFKITSGVLVITESQPQLFRVRARLGLSTVHTFTWIPNSFAMRT